MKHILASLLCICLSVSVLAQTNYQTEYLQGKSYYRSGQYAKAQNVFAGLTDMNERNPFYLYASYFYALSAYQNGQVEKALDQMSRVNATHPKWDKLDELNIWYGKILLEEKELVKGLQVLNGIKNDSLASKAIKLKEKHLTEYDSIPVLSRALEFNPYDSVLAKVLAKKIVTQPIVERNTELLDFLVQEFQLDKASLNYIDAEVSQKKETYRVAVLMPFMFDMLSTAPGKKNTQFVLDLYNGIKMAVSELNQYDQYVRIYAFDTKKDSLQTAGILASGSLDQMDLIIGPLYPGPSNAVREYSLEHKINMLNPLSTNSAVIGNNPFSFLFKTTPESQAKTAAEFAANNFESKNAMIFYGKNKQDSIFAHTYKALIEKDSFNVGLIEGLHTVDQTREVLHILTEVKDKNKNDGRDKVWVGQTRKVRVGEDDELILSRDSIGHIMVASSEGLIVTSILSAIDTRRDSIPIIGFDDWLNIKQISLEQIERMDIKMIAQSYFDYTTREVQNFKQAYEKRFNLVPSQYSYDGYEAMRYFGEKMIKYGNYFQYGLAEEGFEKGKLFYGFDYSNSNDNQVVPILTLKDTELVILKKNSHED